MFKVNLPFKVVRYLCVFMVIIIFTSATHLCLASSSLTSPSPCSESQPELLPAGKREAAAGNPSQVS